MESAPARDNEAAALAALVALDILDSAPEAEFDALVRVASLVCGAPVSILSLVDAERQWFKASVGLPGVKQTPRDLAFCAHAVRGESLFEVGDALQDARFADNPLVTGAPDIRFYAGMPLRLPSGEALGTLCVIDRVPRRLDEAQRQALEHLAAAAVIALTRRRQARACAASEARYRALVEDQNELVSLADGDGRLSFVNRAYAHMFGSTPGAMVGTSLYDYVEPAARARVRAHLEHVCRSKEVVGDENEMTSASGELRWVAWTNRAIVGASGAVEGIHSVGRDVTERRLAEQRLSEKNQRISNILDGTQAGTWEWTIGTGDVQINDQWAALIGHTVADLAPVSFRTWIRLLHPEDRARAGALLEQHFARRSQVYECEVRMRHREGRWVWILTRGRVLDWTADGRPQRMFGTHLDISARKQSEESLRREIEERDRANALLQVAAASLAQAQRLGRIGSWEWQIEPDVTTWSAELYRILGCDPDRPPPSYAEHARIYLPESFERLQAAVQLAVRTGAPYTLELEFRRGDGSPGWVEARGEAVRDAGNRIVGLRGTALDITQMRQLTAELARQHELLRVTLQSIGDAVITTDAGGAITWFNPVAERMTGWTNAEAAGRPLGQVFNIVHEETRKPAPDPVAACLAQGRTVGLAGQTLLISRDGREYGIEDSAAPIRNDAGDFLGVVLVFHDVTEQRRMASEMSYRATHDALTGLVNRAEFETRLRRLLDRTHDDGSESALLFIDLDQFKLVNDACGHSVGDQLLQQVARLFARAVRARDTLARLGGDEFAIILEHCTTEQAERVAEQICNRMDDFRFIHDERRFRIGASIGLAPVDRRWTGTAALVKAADAACYAAKEAGRNRVHTWFDTDLSLRARQGEAQWATRIEEALAQDRFVLHAQRIHPLGGARSGWRAEVLLRLRDADGTLVLPGAFLPAAERFHLATRIDHWVVEHVIGWMNGLESLQGLECLGINLSGPSIGDRAFHRWTVDRLAAAGPEICRRLCLEITETAVVSHLADATVFIDQVRAAGVQVALDDFGTGATSFGYLKSLPVDILKIDGRFIRDLVPDSLDEAAVRCFADVARISGLLTVAKSVERAEVLDRLRLIGVDCAQGVLLHRPAALDQLRRDAVAVRVEPGRSEP